jgi:hypothetical protein
MELAYNFTYGAAKRVKNNIETQELELSQLDTTTPTPKNEEIFEVTKPLDKSRVMLIIGIITGIVFLTGIITFFVVYYGVIYLFD